MDTNTVAVVTEFGNKLDGYINVLAEKVGVAADHFWPLFIQQQVIEGWSGIGFLLFSALFCALSLFTLIKSLPKDDPDKITPKQFVGILTGAIASFILFIVTCVNAGDLPENIAKIKNPEYYAVKSLVTMVK